MASNNLGGKTVTLGHFLTNAENMESIFTRFMCRSSLLVFIIGEPVIDCVDLKIVNLKIDAGAKIERCVLTKTWQNILLKDSDGSLELNFILRILG